MVIVLCTPTQKQVHIHILTEIEIKPLSHSFQYLYITRQVPDMVLDAEDIVMRKSDMASIFMRLIYASGKSRYVQVIRMLA